MLQKLIRKLLFIAVICDYFSLLLSADKNLTNIHQKLQKLNLHNQGDINENQSFDQPESTTIFRPRSWGLRYATCNGRKQSPIDLNFTAPVNQSIKNFKFNFYDKKPASVILKNTGYTVSFRAEWKKETPFVSGGPLKGIYVFEKGHFHWGKNDKKGSEHTIECKRFPLELHLVHYKKTYGSVDKAVNYEDGLVVIALIFEIKRKSHTGITVFGSKLHRLIHSKKESIKVLPFALKDFDLNTDSQFLTYQGSLTTPPCSETVTWIISKQLSTVNQIQMTKFRKIKLYSGRKSNFRPLQWLNKRKTYLFKQ